jgi:large subunit ribosomal protein L17
MRHRKRGRKLGVSPSHRRALGKNMVQALIDHERIVTTVEKAKQFQPLAERVIHLSKTDNLTNKRRVVSLIGDRDLQNKVTVTETTGEGKDAVKKVRVIAATTLQKLFKDIGPRHAEKGGKKERNGGYTRIIKLARRRVGDNASQCLLELVESRSGEGKPYTQVTE